MITAVNEYGFYAIPETYNKREVSRILFAGEVYEPRTLRLLRDYARQGDVISGGSFVGDFLPALAEALPPGGQVHSFEPNPESFAAAQETLRMNRIDTVRLHPVAVGEAPGRLHLRTRFANGAAMGAQARIVAAPAAGATIEVPVEPLDALVPPDRRIAALHLDVEGHEWPALLGARRIIRENAPLLVLEAPKKWRRRDFAQKLAQAFPEQHYRLVGAMERNGFYLPAG